MARPFGANSTTDDVLAGFDLSGKRVLVTGVSAGLGVETARALAAHGAQVVGTARDLDKARRALAEAMQAAASKVELVEVDLASLKSVRAGASELLHSLNSYPVLDVISADSAWLAVTRQHSDTESDLARTGVFETADAGRTWRASALIRAKGDVVALSVAGRKDGWLLRSLGSAAGQNVVGLDRSTDGGRRWEPVRTALPANCDKSGLTFATPATGFITSDCAAGTGAVLVSADGGRHWTQASLPYPALTPCQPSGCAATPPVFFGRTGYLTVGAYPGPGLLLTTHATGATWQVVKLPSGSDPYPRVDFFDARHGVLMPSQPQSRFGRVFYATSDGGLTWRPMRQASTIRAFSSVQFVTSAIGFAWNLNSQSPALYRTANGGETWSRFVPLS